MTLTDLVEIAGSLELVALVAVLLAATAGRRRTRLKLRSGAEQGRIDGRRAA